MQAIIFPSGTNDAKPNFEIVKLMAAHTAIGASLMIMPIIRMSAFDTCSKPRMTR